MRLTLRGYAEAVAESAVAGSAAGALADEIAQVTGLFGRSGELATAITDVGVPMQARRAVLQDLLSERVMPSTLRIVLRAVADERADELPAALVELEALARHFANHQEELLAGGEPPDIDLALGRSAWRARMGGYAAAVLEVLQDVAEIEQVEGELFAFARVVAANPALRSALADHSLPLRARRGVVADLLSGRAHPASVRLIDATLRGRLRDVVGALEWLAEQAAAARGWRVARVEAATELPDEDRMRLADVLSRRFGAPVEVQVTVNPALLGGAVVAIGDLLVDASASHRLEELSERLLGSDAVVPSRAL